MLTYILVSFLWVHTAIPTPAIPTSPIPNPNPIVSIAGVGKAGAPHFCPVLFSFKNFVLFQVTVKNRVRVSSRVRV